MIALYSIAAEHDHMEWNRMRWQALRELQAKGVKPSDIDGGIEYNYTQDPALSNDLILTARTFVNVHRGCPETAKLRWWSISGERYIISRCEIPGWHVERQYPYFSLQSLSSRHIFVISANGSEASRQEP
jgi:hypothetical protein